MPYVCSAEHVDVIQELDTTIGYPLKSESVLHDVHYIDVVDTSINEETKDTMKIDDKCLILYVFLS